MGTAKKLIERPAQNEGKIRNIGEIARRVQVVGAFGRIGEPVEIRNHDPLQSR